jgi:hypothetical protein
MSVTLGLSCIPIPHKLPAVDVRKYTVNQLYALFIYCSIILNRYENIASSGLKRQIEILTPVIKTMQDTYIEELDGTAVSALGVRSRKLSNIGRSSDG